MSGASANLTNSTLADGHEFGLVDEGTASLMNVTVVHNASGGIGGTAQGKLSLTNTIVALNGGSAQCGSISHHERSQPCLRCQLWWRSGIPEQDTAAAVIVEQRWWFHDALLREGW